MKYWNKKIQFKDAGWYMITLPDPTYKWEDLKVWCQQQQGRGKFYTGTYSRNVWYFELEKDASWFCLKWI